MMSNKSILLRNGVALPMLGMGTAELLGEQCKNLVKEALKYVTLIDTAALYQNETAIGEAIAEAGVERSKVFITTKIWISQQGFDNAIAAVNYSLQNLKTNYIDLILIHWPYVNEMKRNSLYPEKMIETYKAMELMLQQGKIKSIGVSNFSQSHLNDLLPHCEIIPHVNQIELNPACYNKELIQFCQSNGITIQGHSPFGKGSLFTNKTILDLAAKCNLSAAQMLINWNLQHDFGCIPKCSSAKRVAENLSLSRSLDENVMSQLDNLHLTYKNQIYPLSMEE